MTREELNIQIALGVIDFDFFYDYDSLKQTVNNIEDVSVLWELIKELYKYQPKTEFGVMRYEWYRRLTLLKNRQEQLLSSLPDQNIYYQ